MSSEEAEIFLRRYFLEHQSKKHPGSTDAGRWIAHLKAMGDLDTFAEELREYSKVEGKP
jgi:hypothetical protein